MKTLDPETIAMLREQTGATCSFSEAAALAQAEEGHTTIASAWVDPAIGRDLDGHRHRSLCTQGCC